MKPDAQLFMMARERKANNLIYALAYTYTTAMRPLIVHHVHAARVQHRYDEV